MTANELSKELLKLADPEKAAFFPRFFKAGPGEYAEGDKFIGVTVPLQRKLAKRYRDLELSEVKNLLASEIHEVRLVALLILTEKMARAKKFEAQKQLVDFYLDNLAAVNNWDLVDSSAYKLLGPVIAAKPELRSIIFELAASGDLWKQRIAIIATLYLIKRGDFSSTIKLAEKYLSHPHDLIHKATGWMLREVGERNQESLIKFLDKHAQKMPRTALRYAIEKLPEVTRKGYLATRT